MPGTNLTRDEALTRAHLLQVDSYTVDLDLTDQVDPARFGSTTVIRFACRTPGSSTFADLVGARIREITLNGRSLDPAEVYAEHRIRLDDLADTNELRVVADCAYSHTGEGLHRFVDPADDRVYLYSQFEVPDARRVYTTFEQPDLKAVFTFHVAAPAHWRVVSNAPTPVPVDHGNGTALWRFPTTPRLSTYVTAIAAGEYHEVLDSYVGPHGEIPLGHYCRQSVKEHLDVSDLVELTRQGFAFFEETFDYPYPFRKYDQVYVPEFNEGAMENAGCIILRDEYLPRSRQSRQFYEFRADTVLHEMAHMWFGDLVTMRWWDDLWLNESFAEWAATYALDLVTQYDESWTAFANHRKNWAYYHDQLPTSHPVAADNPDLETVEVSFDGITYAKGAAAIKQLVAWVGEEEFLTGLRSYFKKHAFANSEFADLLGALEQTSGRDLHAWAEEWLRTAGVNTLTPVFELDREGRYASFAVAQTADPDFPTLRRHRIGVGLYDRDANGHLVRRTSFETDVHGELTALESLVGVTQPDLLLLNDGDLAYAKLRLDARSLATVRESIHLLDDTLARAVCWAACWDMTRDAAMSPGDFVELVLNGLATESDMTAMKYLPMYVHIAIWQYASAASRAALALRWETGLRALAGSAEPGSDTQLAAVRTLAGWSGKRVPPSSYAGAARSAEGLDFLAGLLDESVVLDGLTVDTDLRWMLLTGLASAGRVDRARIAKELEQDHTISGKELAAAALAAMPTQDTKAEAWELATARDDVANETQRAVAYVFDVADQHDVLAPYLEKYLAVAETIWEDKGVQLARTTLEYMFPRALTSHETRDRVAAWLRQSSANPAAKRFVREGLAGIERALAAREKDASPAP